MSKRRKTKNLSKITIYTLIITAIAIIMLSGTYARFSSRVEGTDSARVAKWNILVNGTSITQTSSINFNLFDTILDTDGAEETDIATVLDSEGNKEKLIAPGTMGKFYATVTNASEVLARYKISYTVSETSIPLEYTLTPNDENSWKADIAQAVVEKYSYLGIDATENTATIYWRWAFEDETGATKDTVDTTIGKDGTTTITVTAAITAEQVDDIVGDETIVEETEMSYFTLNSAGEISLNSLNKDEFASVTKLVIPSAVLVDGEYKKVTSVADYGFAECTNLTELVIPNNITSIGNSSFEGCTNIQATQIASTVETIGQNAFWKCENLEQVVFETGSKLTTIGKWAFDDCVSLKSIVIPNSVTNIGESAFSNCTELTSVTLSKNITKIDKWTFFNCSALTEITIPDKVTLIDEGAFGKCTALTTVQLGNNVTTIGDSAFYLCENLETINLEKVTNIADNAFQYCDKLNVGGGE